MVTLEGRRWVSQLMCAGIAHSSAPSPSKPETNEINWAVLHRGDADRLVTSLLKGWLWVSQQGIQGTISCRGTSGRQLWFGNRGDFSETASQ